MLSYAKIHQTEELTEIATLVNDDFHWQSTTFPCLFSQTSVKVVDQPLTLKAPISKNKFSHLFPILFL